MYKYSYAGDTRNNVDIANEIYRRMELILMWYSSLLIGPILKLRA